MKPQPKKVQDNHLHGGLHYSQTYNDLEGANLDGLDEAGAKGDNTDSASFLRSAQSLEALVTGKIAKLDAYKNILSAEVKLSLSAILVCVCIVLVLLVITLGLWLGINGGVALFVFQITQSLAWTAITVITINLLLCAILGLGLRKSWSLIGLSHTIAAATRTQ